MNRIRVQRRCEIFLFIQSMKKKELDALKNRLSEDNLLNRLPFIKNNTTSYYETDSYEPNQWDYI